MDYQNIATHKNANNPYKVLLLIYFMVARWSATRINTANYCRMRHWLTYVDPRKPKRLRLSVYVKGSLLHGLIENFWEKLGTPEEVDKKSSRKKYHDAEGFAKYAKGKWQSIIIADNHLREKYEQEQDEEEAEKLENKLIYWRDNNDKYQIKNTLPKICKPLFDSLHEEGPPLFTELSFNFVIGDKRFRGKIDEVRKRDGKIVIRDYKSGRPWVGYMKASFDTQLTLYNVGLCSLAHENEEIAEKLGLEKKVVEQYMGNPRFIDPNFIVEFFMIEALSIDLGPRIKTIPPVIVSSYRNDNHFFELIKMINGSQRDIDTGNIYPERGRKCDSCDVRHVCEDQLYMSKAGELTDKNGQKLFSFVIPYFMLKDEQESEYEQGRLRLRRKSVRS